MKILLAAIFGGIAMFIWTSIAHLVLPLGEAGISEIPNESAVLSALQSNIGDQTGLYIFPGLGIGKNATREEKNEAMKQIAAKAASGPSGILMYHPTRVLPSANGWASNLAPNCWKRFWLCVPARPNTHCEFRRSSRLRVCCQDPGSDGHERLPLELVRIPFGLYRQLHG
jgi:hypothetical protein